MDLPVLHGHRKKFIDCQTAKVRIAVHPIMNVKTHWNSAQELLEQPYWLLEFTREWLENLKYTEYQPLFTTKDDCMIVKYVMEVLRPFRYWTQWIWKRHTVTLHHVITVYNDMFKYMDSAMRALARKKTQWKEDLFFAVKLVWLNMLKYYAKVTPMTSMLLISAHILNTFRKFRSLRKWEKGMDINPQNETFYTTQYQEAFLRYVENEYCAIHRRVPVNKLQSLPSSNPISSEMASRSCQSSFDPYDLFSDDEEYLTPDNVAETTPGRSHLAACWLTAVRLYLNLPPDVPTN